MIAAMSFEFMGRKERPKESKTSVERAENMQAQRVLWQERVERTARLAALAAAIAAPAGLAHAGEIDLTSADEQTEISRSFDVTPSSGKIVLASGETVQIPTTADHFNKVTVYAPPHASRVLIFFQPNHLHIAEEMQGLSDRAKLAGLGAVEQSQKIIYEELEKLGKKGVIKSVCQEGVIATPDNKNARNLIKSLSDPKQFNSTTTTLVGPYLFAAQEATTQYFDLTNKPGELDAAENDKIKKRFEPYFHSIAQQYPHVVGAAEILASKGVISLCGAEEQDTYAASWGPDVRAIMARPPSEWTADERKLVKKKVVDDREGAALRQTLAQEGSTVALEFGAGHKFTAAIMRWNINHPNQQIALVQADAFQAVAPEATLATKNAPTEYGSLENIK